MNFPIWIARRYFLSGKKLNFINLVSLVSIIVVAFVTMSLVIALSVFNGLEDLIRNIFNSFDPEIKVTAVQGKTFHYTDGMKAKIARISGVRYVTEVLEDHALIKYREEQLVVKVKGLSQEFIDEHRIDAVVIEGKAALIENGLESAIVGQGVQYLLSININNKTSPIQLLYPKSVAVGNIDPTKLINNELIGVSGVFAIEKQYDDSYIFVPLSFAQRLFGVYNQRSALEIKTDGSKNISEVQEELKKLLGDKFLVQNSDEQHASLLKAIKVEKLFMQTTISFIFAIASLNIFFCLTMLAIKKRKDISILYALGTPRKIIRNIFLMEGILIAFTGVSLGIFLGLSVCVLQQKFGIISMGMETSLVDAYPVKLELLDFLFIFITVFSITVLASIHPASRATKTSIKEFI